MTMATVTPPWAYTLQLPQDPRGPGIARATLRTVLTVHGMRDLVDVAELLASELVTNAYRYSSGPYSLRLRGAGRDRVRVGVWDSSPEIPAPFGGCEGARWACLRFSPSAGGGCTSCGSTPTVGARTRSGADCRGRAARCCGSSAPEDRSVGGAT